MNHLIPTQAPTPAKYASDKSFDSVAKASQYLPRVQLFQSSSKLVTKKQIESGNFGIVDGKTLFDLTSSFICCNLGWRPKALRMDGQETKAYYNPDSELFKKVAQDSKVQNSGCMYGPEFLVYIPDSGKFVTFFFGSPTLRREAPAMRGLQNKVVSVKSDMIEKGSYTWYSALCSEYTGPVNLPGEGTPEAAELTTRITEEQLNFNNPPEAELEPEEDATPERAR